MVLLEAALAIPLLLVVALGCLGAARVATTEIAAAAAAREAALQAARGESTARIAARWPDADVEVDRAVDTATATVRMTSHPLPGFSPATVHHRAVAVAAIEPGLR
jgi:Flp pilus assembly protein TadG